MKYDIVITIIRISMVELVGMELILLKSPN